MLDPQWLSNQLCTLISFKKDFIEQGFLTPERLSDAWKDIPQKDHKNIVKLFCEFGICFPIEDVGDENPGSYASSGEDDSAEDSGSYGSSDEEEHSACLSTLLFPCKLPVGMPDNDKWPMEPKDDEKQLTLIFQFDVLSFDFFPRYIVEINRRKKKFHQATAPFSPPTTWCMLQREDPVHAATAGATINSLQAIPSIKMCIVFTQKYYYMKGNLQ